MSLDVGKKNRQSSRGYWTAGGNEFQMTDAATGNERRPTVVRRYAGNVQQLGCGRAQTVAKLLELLLCEWVSVVVGRCSSVRPFVCLSVTFVYLFIYYEM